MTDLFNRMFDAARAADMAVAATEDQVFRDPAVRDMDSFRVFWKGRLLPVDFNSKGAAAAYLDGLRAGRKPS